MGLVWSCRHISLIFPTATNKQQLPPKTEAEPHSAHQSAELKRFGHLAPWPAAVGAKRQAKPDLTWTLKPLNVSVSLTGCGVSSVQGSMFSRGANDWEFPFPRSSLLPCVTSLTLTG